MRAAHASADLYRAIERQGNDVDVAGPQLADNPLVVGIHDDAAFLENQSVRRQEIGLVDRDLDLPSFSATSAAHRSAFADSRPIDRA
jgi:hypothetical protein